VDHATPLPWRRQIHPVISLHQEFIVAIDLGCFFKTQIELKITPR
jgi:hypothetical protein